MTHIFGWNEVEHVSDVCAQTDVKYMKEEILEK